MDTDDTTQPSQPVDQSQPEDFDEAGYIVLVSEEDWEPWMEGGVQQKGKECSDL